MLPSRSGIQPKQSTPHLSPPPFPPWYLTSPAPFPPCHITPLPYLSTSLLSPTFPTLPPHLSPHPSHLATSPLSQPFPPHHLLTFPNLPPHHHPPFPPCHLTTSPPFQPSQLIILPPSQLVPHIPRDLTVAINITTNKVSHILIEAQPFLCNTNLRLQIPHTSNSLKPHIYSIPRVLTSFK